MLINEKGRVIGGPMAVMSGFTSNLYDEVPAKT
jgi:hypothetical protein